MLLDVNANRTGRGDHRTRNSHPLVRLAKTYYDETPRMATVGALGAAQAIDIKTLANQYDSLLSSQY
jgi:hypothetical protein